MPISEWYAQYLQSPHWQRVRERTLDLARHQCELCGERNKPLDVHHKTYENLWHEQLADVAALCRYCHESIHALPDYAADFPFGMAELIHQLADMKRADALMVKNGRSDPSLPPPTDDEQPAEEQDEPDGDPDEPPDYHWLLFSERRYRTPNGRNEPAKRDPMYNL